MTVPPKMEVIADLAIDLGRAGVVAAGQLIPEPGKGDAAIGRDIVPGIGRAQAQPEIPVMRSAIDRKVIAVDAARGGDGAASKLELL